MYRAFFILKISSCKLNAKQFLSKIQNNDSILYNNVHTKKAARYRRFAAIILTIRNILLVAFSLQNFGCK